MPKRTRNAPHEEKGRKKPQEKRKKPLFTADDDEEIDSDFGEHSEEASNNSSEDESHEISPEQQRLRLARKYLTDAGLGQKLDEEVAEQLARENARASKRATYRLHSYWDKAEENAPGVFYKGHLKTPTCLAVFDNDPTQAFTGGKDKAVIHWDITTGQKVSITKPSLEVKPTEGHTRAVLCVAATCDRKVVLSGGDDTTVKIWDIRTMSRPVGQLLAHRGPVTGLAADAVNPSRAYSIGRDSVVRSWNLITRGQPQEFFGHTAAGTAMDLLVSERPVTGGADGTVRFWRIDNESHLILDHHKQPVDACAALSPTRCLGGCQAGEITLWSVGHRKPIGVLPRAHDAHGIRAIGCLKYSDFFVSGSNDGFLRGWRTLDIEGKNGKLERTEITSIPQLCIPLRGSVNGIKIEKDVLIAAVGQEHRLGRWEREAGNVKNGIYIQKLKLPVEECGL